MRMCMRVVCVCVQVSLLTPPPSLHHHQPICLDDFASAEELEALDPLRLKKALQVLGVKCGGTPRERAARLFATKGKKAEELDPSMFAKPRRKRK